MNQGLELLNKAADTNNGVAERSLGLIWLEGRAGVEKDEAKAASLFKVSAIVAIVPARALIQRTLQRAVDHGQVEAAYNLGCLCMLRLFDAASATCLSRSRR